MRVASKVKDADNGLTVSFDWSAVAPAVVATSEWAVEPSDDAGLLVSTTIAGPHETVAELSGGAFGSVYLLSNRIFTSLGDERVRSILVRIDRTAATFAAGGPSLGFGLVSLSAPVVAGEGVSPVNASLDFSQAGNSQYLPLLF